MSGANWSPTDRALMVNQPYRPWVPPRTETVVLNGVTVRLFHVPEVSCAGHPPGQRGCTGPAFDGSIAIHVKEGDPDLDRIVLHEYLHALLMTDPQRIRVDPNNDPRSEALVQMLTAGLFDVLGYRRSAGMA